MDETVVRIGSKNRGGAVERESVVKGKSALNAAQRSGAIIGTEKKYGAGNATSRPGVEGQHLTKVDRSDDIVKPKVINSNTCDAIKKYRNQAGLSQKELATKCNIHPSILQQMEKGEGTPDQKAIGAMERVLKVKLRGDKIGEPLFAKKK